ncbi:MAG: macro domain-containing protein, partial [Candidatus Sulfotelmatobacter sp.]
SLAFPAISTGAYGYPVAEAASVAVSSTITALASARHITKVRFVLFDLTTLRTYKHAAEELAANTSPPLRIEKIPL